jgi:hypothetical protein
MTIAQDDGLTRVDLFGTEWVAVRSDAPELFDRLRQLSDAEIYVRFNLGVEQGHRVEVPAVSLTLRGELAVEGQVDRFGVLVEGWAADDFAWFSRRKGRGRTDYWQAAIEHRPSGAPALVLYLTAALDGLELRVRSTPPAASP